MNADRKEFAFFSIRVHLGYPLLIRLCFLYNRIIRIHCFQPIERFDQCFFVAVLGVRESEVLERDLVVGVGFERCLVLLDRAVDVARGA